MEFGDTVAGLVRTAAYAAARNEPANRVVDASTLLWLAVPGESGRVPTIRQVERQVHAGSAWRVPFKASTDGLLAQDLAGADPVSQLLRQARLSVPPDRFDRGPVRWHGSVMAGLLATLDEARAAGVETTGHLHLVAGLLRACTETLSGQPADEHLAGLRAEPAWREPGRPYTPVVSQLAPAREMSERTGLGGWLDRKLRRAEVGDSRYGGAVTPSVIREAMRQTVRLDDGPVTAAHLLLGIAGLGEQLRTAGRRLRSPLLPFNGAPDLLDAHGVTLERAVAALPAARPEHPVIAPTGRVQLVIWTPWPQWTAEAVDAVNRAVDLAREAGHPETGTTHLAVAALEPEDGTAARLLLALGVSRAELLHQLREAAPPPERRADRSPAKARRLSP
ncbi:Clp protease N-terminal domain-containing protein [Dactylosporangium siamense]|uniref:Clp R domain-containing protein n=1 Tax=Dactylosporangium siamense TaxID=685454 RepID=A0A919PXG8_9ACTN|nr:Clp protease N-terminal domain-containing protein [Dactylosporangium siamense]GIG51467.1 hypothetical protein Dsi01nite_095080 [Dactylosporangium siamense]